ncbi:MAG: hypothetical protein NVS1B7_0690 [Candidatus Saccharimonadales bacterium]
MNRLIQRLHKLLQTYRLVLASFLVVLAVSSALLYTIASHQNRAARNSTCTVAACINLLRNNKDPLTYTITSGSYVQFNSADGMQHSMELVHSGVQHDDPSRYESGTFSANEAWKVQFKKDGTFVFADKTNPDVEITIIVYTPGKDYKIKST